MTFRFLHFVFALLLRLLLVVWRNMKKVCDCICYSKITVTDESAPLLILQDDNTKKNYTDQAIDRHFRCFNFKVANGHLAANLCCIAVA